MRKVITASILSIFIGSAHAVDVTSRATQDRKFDKWQVVEFAMPTQLLYRVSTISINDRSQTLTFDMDPSKGCQPAPAVLVIENKTPSKASKEGMLIFEYKYPNQDSNVEIVNTLEQKNDRFEFAVFKKLTIPWLLGSNDAGKLAIWIPPSGDGVVKRSENIYFPLQGMTPAYNYAKKLCNDNK
jgi:hypothetical protein